jgi:hypothetical protein
VTPGVVRELTTFAVLAIGSILLLLFGARLRRRLR